MKKILIVAENIGVDENVDSKIINIVREFSDDIDIHTYSRQFILNESGEYLRMKGIAVHNHAVTLTADMPQEYFAIIAFDVWAVKSTGMFTADKKIRVGEKTSSISIIKELNAEDKKK
jgi:hypothetical protein